MGGILHIPQGAAQVSIINQIPENPVIGQEVGLQEALETYGAKTWCWDPANGHTATVDTIWDAYEGWEKSSGMGDTVVINDTKHYGLNTQPQSSQPESGTQTLKDFSKDNDRPAGQKCRIKFMLIDEVLDFASERMFGRIRLSESTWTTTTVYVYLIPYVSSQNIAQVLTRFNNYLDGTTDTGIIPLTPVAHSGSTTGGLNDQVGVLFPDNTGRVLPSPGKYRVAFRTESFNGPNDPADQACPSIYELNFRTY